MTPSKIASLKNYKNSKFSYPKINRNKSQSNHNLENDNFDKFEKSNPEATFKDRKKYYYIT